MLEARESQEQLHCSHILGTANLDIAVQTHEAFHRPSLISGRLTSISQQTVVTAFIIITLLGCFFVVVCLGFFVSVFKLHVSQDSERLSVEYQSP